MIGWICCHIESRPTRFFFLLPFEQVGVALGHGRRTPLHSGELQCIVCFLLSSWLKGSYMYGSQIWNLCIRGIKQIKIISSLCCTAGPLQPHQPPAVREVCLFYTTHQLTFHTEVKRVQWKQGWSPLSDLGQKGVLFLFAISKSNKQPAEPVEVPLGQTLTHFLPALCKQWLQ